MAYYTHFHNKGYKKNQYVVLFLAMLEGMFAIKTCFCKYNVTRAKFCTTFQTRTIQTVSATFYKSCIPSDKFWDIRLCTNRRAFYGKVLTGERNE